MYFIEKTIEFDKWMKKLKDLKGKAKILFRIQKIETDGHFGDCKPVGNGIRELRVNFAKGYRVYFKEKDGKIIILLVGGDIPKPDSFYSRLFISYGSSSVRFARFGFLSCHFDFAQHMPFSLYLR